MPPVSQVFCVSRCLAQPCEIEGILRGARVANERRGITGLLVHSGAWFAQWLEGEAGDVRDALADIRADRRHADLRTLLERDAPDRACAQWRMAFLDAPGADALLADLHAAPRVPAERIDRLLARLSRGPLA